MARLEAAVQPVRAIGEWKNNAEMILDIRRLGYLDDAWSILDPTHHEGKFWNLWRPANLVATDLDPSFSTMGSVDVRDLPFPDGHFDAAVFDGPYKLNGTSGHGGPAELDDSYGVGGAYVPVGERHALLREGTAECIRVTRPLGYVLVKCQDQVANGQVHWQTRMIDRVAARAGADLVDMLHLVGGRAQSDKRRQVHARRNYSTMMVFRVRRPTRNRSRQ